eukprot:11485317-Alexandrium_andersonii.AAC.1
MRGTSQSDLCAKPGGRVKGSTKKILKSCIMRASFLKGMTREEAKFLPVSIAQAQVVPVTHEQKTFDSFEIDSHRQTRAMEASDGKRSLVATLGK